MDDQLGAKIAHLQMIQGVISRMASDTQKLKTFAVTIAAAIIALGQVEGASTGYLAPAGFLTIIILWQLTARHLHIEHAYRCLYDEVRKGNIADQFSMDWHPYSPKVPPTIRLAVSWSVLLPYLSVAILLVIFAIL